MYFIPQPQSVTLDENRRFKLTSLSLGENLLSSEAQEDFLSFCAMSEGKENIIFKTDPSLGEEEYILTSGERITVTASAAAGQLYALETLKQIIFQSDGDIPYFEIKDKPKYKLRGILLDSGRYFFPVEDVKRIIRRMALHKLNLLHFHITEDQGWRIEIKKYPLLTEYGSVRKKTNFNHTPHGGFYTQEDIKEIVAYAHAFCIKVMPEFDIPGHSRAAIACYNELTCFPRRLPVATHWGVKHDVLCVGKDKTIAFVKDIFDELFELFPDKYYHIGGDEVPKHRWNLCPECQKKIKELGLKNSEHLQFWFMNEMKEYCKAHGKQVFMWSWELEDDSLIDTDLGFTKCGEMETGDRPFIDTSTSAYYIDFPYGYTSLKKCADHELLSGNCLGAEGTLWSEYIPDMKTADRLAFPRTACISQNSWNGSCSWDMIKDKLGFYYSYLDKNSIGYSDIKTANPGRLRGMIQILWFERRRLTWEGIPNLVGDKRVEHIARRTPASDC